MGYFSFLYHPPGREIWLLSRVRDMSWKLGNPCCTKLSVVNFLYIACDVRYPNNFINQPFLKQIFENVFISCRNDLLLKLLFRDD